MYQIWRMIVSMTVQDWVLGSPLCCQHRHCTGSHRSSSPSWHRWCSQCLTTGDLLHCCSWRTGGFQTLLWSTADIHWQLQVLYWSKYINFLIHISLPFANESHSICVILMEKVLEKDWPAVTTVRTTGLLLERPMSTYTNGRRNYMS